MVVLRVLKNKTSVSEVSDLLLRTCLSFFGHLQLKGLITENRGLQIFQPLLCSLQGLIVLRQVFPALLHLSFYPQREVLLPRLVDMKHVSKPFEGLNSHFFIFLQLFQLSFLQNLHITAYLLNLGHLFIDTLL